MRLNGLFVKTLKLGIYIEKSIDRQSSRVISIHLLAVTYLIYLNVHGILYMGRHRTPLQRVKVTCWDYELTRRRVRQPRYLRNSPVRTV